MTYSHCLKAGVSKETKMTKLKFTQESEDDHFWLIKEEGENTDKIKFEVLGLIFIDELGIHWNISEDYSGIIELEELKQIVNFMEELKKGGLNSSQP